MRSLIPCPEHFDQIVVVLGVGLGVNNQMQIVNTKLPDENIETYQAQMINSGGWGVNDQMQIVNTKLPNENI